MKMGIVWKHDLWKVAPWEDGFSDGVGGLLVLCWIGRVWHVPMENS
jgi:hypothetical protein